MVSNFVKCNFIIKVFKLHQTSADIKHKKGWVKMCYNNI